MFPFNSVSIKTPILKTKTKTLKPVKTQVCNRNMSKTSTCYILIIYTTNSELWLGLADDSGPNSHRWSLRHFSQNFKLFVFPIFQFWTYLMKKSLKIPKIRISKNRQHNGQKKKYKRTNNNRQNIHIKINCNWY